MNRTTPQPPGMSTNAQSSGERSSYAADGSDTDMIRNNVNPNHHEISGRKRQDEGIAQDRNKQTRANNPVGRRTEVGAKVRKPVARDSRAVPDAGPTRSAKTATRRTPGSPLQAPPGHRRGQNLVPGSSAPHARFPKAARGAAIRPAGPAPQLKAKQAAKRASANLLGADKGGKRSTAQKRTSRREFDPMRATNAVPGSFGKEPSRRPPPMRK